MTIKSDIQKFSPGNLVELFILDCSSFGGSVYRFYPAHSGQAVDAGLTARGTAMLDGDTVTKASGVEGYGDADCYSAASYRNGALVSFRSGMSGKEFVGGLSQDPDADMDWTSIDFGISLNWSMQSWSCVESGAGVATFNESYATDDVFAVLYDGADVKYMKNGVVKYSRAASAGLVLHADFSLALVGAVVADIRFHKPDLPILFQGEQYLPFPVKASGFEILGRGQAARPKFTLSNVDGVLGLLCRQYDDLVGAKVTRKRTFSRYLDGEPGADPAAELPQDIFYVERKTLEDDLVVEYEVTGVWDLDGVMLPRRQVTGTCCMWVYRSAECGYAGGPVADADDVPTTDPQLDDCGKRVGSCKLRFGETAELPYGAFPSVGRIY